MATHDLLYPDLAELGERLATAATATSLRVRSPDFPAQTLLARLIGADLPALRDLSLDDCKLTADDLATLLDSALLARLHRLDLADETLDETALREFVASPRLANLVHLRLDVREVPVHRLVHNPALRRLAGLELPTVREPRDLAALLTAPFPAAHAWRPRVLDRALELARDEPFLQRWDDLGPLVAALDAKPVPSDTIPAPSDTPDLGPLVAALDAKPVPSDTLPAPSYAPDLGAPPAPSDTSPVPSDTPDLGAPPAPSNTSPVPSDTPDLGAPPAPSNTQPAPSDTSALAAALARWPTYTRHALSAWLAAALAGPSPALRRAGNLDLHCLRGVPREAEDLDLLTALLAHPDAAHIHRVDLRYLSLPTDELARWLRGPWLTRIHALDLHGHTLTAPVLAALVDNPAATGLRALHLCDSLGDHDAVTALFTSPLLARLHALDLSCNALGAAGVRLLAAAPLTHLRGLNLRACRLTAGHLAALAPARWPALERLTLSENNLGDAAARILAEIPLPALTRLDLGYPGPKPPSALTDRGARALAKAVSWASLQDLGLEFCQVGDAGALALATASKLPDLRRLRIAYGNRITAAGAQALVAAAPPRLHLDIAGGSNHHLRAPDILASHLAAPLDLDLPDPFDLR